MGVEDGVAVPRQRPLQTSVGVQWLPGSHSFPPMMHGLVGKLLGGSVLLEYGVGVSMHWPPQSMFVSVQYMVGVQVDAVGQGASLPTVHGITGGKTCSVRQRPPQTSVWVQVEPVGQESPPRWQVERGGGRVKVGGGVAREVVTK